MKEFAQDSLHPTLWRGYTRVYEKTKKGNKQNFWLAKMWSWHYTNRQDPQTRPGSYNSPLHAVLRPVNLIPWCEWEMAVIREFCFQTIISLTHIILLPPSLQLQQIHDTLKIRSIKIDALIRFVVNCFQPQEDDRPQKHISYFFTCQHRQTAQQPVST